MNGNDFFLQSSLLVRLDYPAKKLDEIINQNRGARIGESTVISKKVHTYDPAHPEEIRILQDIDAGQAFYQRQCAGQVYHLDIFHERGLVDHRLVARAIKDAVSRYNISYIIENCLMTNRSNEEVKADLIDVQTGTGGGRITGNLNYGGKMSLRRAHENHVHVAAIIPPEHIACLFVVVMSVEDSIQSCQLEIRQNEKIIHQRGGGNGTQDMSAYSDNTDSYLRDKKSVSGMSRSVQKYQYIQDALDLMNDFEQAEDLLNTLKGAESQRAKSSLVKDLEKHANGEKTLDRLSAMGIIDCRKNKVQLTEYGKELLNYIRMNMPEIEAHFRHALALVKPVSMVGGRRKTPLNNCHVSGIRSLRWISAEKNWIGELDTAATVVSAAQRIAEEKHSSFYISAEDIRQNAKRKRKKVEICLVLDASASMAGQRLKAAKFLTKHLLFSTPDRIGVVVFQDQSAQVLVPLTRKFKQVETNLQDLRAFGSTPLAQGLRICLDHLNTASARNPLIVLITDGVATYSQNTRDPMGDALNAAKEIKAAGYDFTCIGLKPHKNYLGQLAESAGGTIYVVDELEKQGLIQAVWSEYTQRC